MPIVAGWVPLEIYSKWIFMSRRFVETQSQDQHPGRARGRAVGGGGGPGARGGTVGWAVGRLGRPQRTTGQGGVSVVQFSADLSLDGGYPGERVLTLGKEVLFFFSNSSILLHL